MSTSNISQPTIACKRPSVLSDAPEEPLTFLAWCRERRGRPGPVGDLIRRWLAANERPRGPMHPRRWHAWAAAYDASPEAREAAARIWFEFTWARAARQAKISERVRLCEQTLRQAQRELARSQALAIWRRS